MKTSKQFAMLAMIVAAPHLGAWVALAIVVWFVGQALYWMRRGD